MKTTVRWISFILLLSLAFCLTSCGNHTSLGFGGTNVSYDNADKYAVGGTTLSPDGVKNLDVSWISGQVDIRYGETEKIVIAETPVTDVPDEQLLRYWFDGKTLHIRYCAAGKYKTGELVTGKVLSLTLPSGLTLDTLCANSASAAFITSVEAEKYSFDSASGDVAATVKSPENLKINTASGDVLLVGEDLPVVSIATASGGVNVRAQSVGRAEINTASGDVTVNVENASDFTVDTASGDVTVNVATASDFTIDTASGDVTVNVAIASDFTIDTASGNVTLAVSEDYEKGKIETISGGVSVSLPKGAGSKIKYATTSGTVTIANERKDKSGTVSLPGDGTRSLEISTTSGDVTVSD